MVCLSAPAFAQAKKEPDPAKTRGTWCRVTDASGTVLAETTVDTNAYTCRMMIEDKLVADRCAPGKRIEGSFTSSGAGKDAKNDKYWFNCPKK